MEECTPYGGTPTKRTNISGGHDPRSSDKRSKLYGDKEGIVLDANGGKEEFLGNGKTQTIL